MKYIIFEDGPVVFSDVFPHYYFKNIDCLGKPLSAGFCDYYCEDEEMKLGVYGESVSLQLKSNPKDAEILWRLFQGE